jgi:uncharacterized protein
MLRFSRFRRISNTLGAGRSNEWPHMHASRSADPDGPLTVPRRCAVAALRAYQVAVSPMFAGSCRFVPSCSAYAVEAITRFGIMRGSWLILRRLARCRPFAAHGFDPVPSRCSHD